MKLCKPYPAKCWRCHKFNGIDDIWKFDECKELSVEEKKKIRDGHFL